MNQLNQKVLAACSDVEKQIAALQAFVDEKKSRAETTELKDWGELGDVTHVREVLNQIPCVGGTR